MQTSNLFLVPSEILAQIPRYLDPVSLVRLSRTCKVFRNAYEPEIRRRAEFFVDWLLDYLRDIVALRKIACYESPEPKFRTENFRIGFYFGPTHYIIYLSNQWTWKWGVFYMGPSEYTRICSDLGRKGIIEGFIKRPKSRVHFPMPSQYDFWFFHATADIVEALGSKYFARRDDIEFPPPVTYFISLRTVPMKRLTGDLYLPRLPMDNILASIKPILTKEICFGCHANFSHPNMKRCQYDVADVFNLCRGCWRNPHWRHTTQGIGFDRLFSRYIFEFKGRRTIFKSYRWIFIPTNTRVRGIQSVSGRYTSVDLLTWEIGSDSDPSLRWVVTAWDEENPPDVTLDDSTHEDSSSSDEDDDIIDTFVNK